MSPPGAPMRLFVALVPPADALAELAAAVDALRSTPGLRWTRPEQWHVTLAFLAEVDDRTRAALVPRLERAAHRHAPLTLALAGGGRFGQVLWTRVDGDRVALRGLADSRAGRRSAVRAADRRAALPSPPHPRARGPPGARSRPARHGPRRVRGQAVDGVGPAPRAQRPRRGPGWHRAPRAACVVAVVESIVKVHLAWVVPALRRGHDPRPWPGSTSTSTIRTRRRSTGSWWSSTRSCATAATGCSSCGAPMTATGSCPAGASRWARRPPKPSAGRSSRRAASRSR